MAHDARQRLKRLLHTHGERSAPIVFAGRQSIIRDVLERVDSMADQPTPGQTFIVSGAPGAGKTSLLTELSKRSARPCIVRGEVPNNETVPLIWNMLAEKLTGIPLKSLMSTRHEERRGEAGVDTILKAGTGFSTGMSQPPLPIASCEHIRALSDEQFKTPLILCIDEIQNIEQGSKASELVRELHTQSIAPILLVCAGLSNSGKRLRDIGLSRPMRSNVISLGTLEPQETLFASRESLRMIGETANIESGALVDALAEQIAIASDDWPRHLACYLNAVCKALIEQATPDFSCLDQSAVIERGHVLRREYYEERLVASELPAHILAGLYRKFHDSSLSSNDCADVLEAEIERSDSSTLKRRFATGEDALDQSLRAGVLALNENNTCAIPIPSLADFMFERARQT